MIINLLPKEYRDDFSYEKMSRFALLFHTRMFLALAVGATLLIPSYIYLTYEAGDISREIDITRKSIETQNVAAIEQVIRDVNAKIAVLNQPSGSLPTEIIQAIVENTPSQVTVQNMLYNKQNLTVRIDGYASSRDTFLEVLGNLKKDAHFSAVDSPLSNLFRDQEVSFTLTLRIAPQPQP